MAAGLVILAGSAAVGGAANADQRPGSLPGPSKAESTLGRVPPRGDACYRQFDGDDFDGATSQNFEKPKDTFDAMGADDFVLRGECQVTSVSVKGSYLNHMGPPSSIHVIFYLNDAGQVGKVLSNQDGLSFTTPVQSSDFVVALSRPVRLAAGRYWVTVQANMNSSTQGYWYWSTNDVQRNYKARWINPKGGWGTFCTTWKTLVQCLGPDLDPDFTFELLK